MALAVWAALLRGGLMVFGLGGRGWTGKNGAGVECADGEALEYFGGKRGLQGPV